MNVTELWTAFIKWRLPHGTHCGHCVAIAITSAAIHSALWVLAFLLLMGVL